MRIVIEEAGVEYRITSDRKIRTPQEASDAVSPVLSTLSQEAFVVLSLDSKNGMRSSEISTIGILDATLIHPREVFKIAISKNAAAIIVVHNHPSGDPTPSAEDVRITKTLVQAGHILNIPVLDHVVIGKPDATTGRGEFISMREAGLVSFEK